MVPWLLSTGNGTLNSARMMTFSGCTPTGMPRTLGGLDEIHRAISFRRRFSVRLPRFERWTNVRNTYITWQIANASVFYPTQGGDFYKGAQVVDVFGYEGGMRFVKNAGKKVGLLEEVLLGWGGQHSHKFFIDFLPGGLLRISRS